jgi:hypothetical protein
MAKTIAIDFDGVIHKYSKGWQDGEIYDSELPCVFEAIQDLMGEGYTVFVFSTRKPAQIKRWLKGKCYTSYPVGMGFEIDEVECPKYGFEVEIIHWWQVIFRKNFFWNKKNVLGITNIKLAAHSYIDDRALKFNGNWMDTLEELRTFKTYQQ